MPLDGYTLYSQWCRDHGQEPPTKEWWDWACAASAGKGYIALDPEPEHRKDQREIDRERREGWAYD